MKITKEQIKKIIQEEIQGLLNETDTKRGDDGKKVKKTGGGRSVSKKEREQSKGKRTKDGKIVKPSGVGGAVDEVEPIPRKNVHMIDEAGPTPHPSPRGSYEKLRNKLQDGEVKHVDAVVASL